MPHFVDPIEGDPDFDRGQPSAYGLTKRIEAALRACGVDATRHTNAGLVKVKGEGRRNYTITVKHD